MHLVMSLGCIVAIACILLNATLAQTNFQQQCLSLQPESFPPNTTLEELTYVQNGTNLTFPDNDPSCNRSNQVVAADLCRIALSIPTSNRSSITLELWLPEQWSGRFLGTGNGGLDGCIKYEDLAYTTRYGFASFGTNGGHNGTRGTAFLDNPDIVTDFSHRALHTGVTVSKAITQSFYGQPYNHSYYLGCSLGGRQGMKAAEMYPEDFDGIVAGSPAVDFNNLVSWRESFFSVTGPANTADFIAPAMWQGLIHNEVLKQCDTLDGVADGIIEDPTICNFRPEALLCPSNTTFDGPHPNCITPTQVQQIRSIFSPFYGENGTLVYPAMQPGSEILASSPSNGLYAGKPFAYSYDWFRYVVYSDPSWNASTFSVRDVAAAQALNPADIQTWPSYDALTPFWSRGGKILSYHGQQDNQITSFNTERFYDYLAGGLAQSNQSSNSTLDDCFRFFRISGMFHCNTGPGAWVVGQGGGSSAEGLPFDPQRNVLAAVVSWIENGTAPETIEGTKFVGDDSSLGESFRRRHCRFPLRNTYITGNASLPESWQCMETAWHCDPMGAWCKDGHPFV